MKLVLLAAIPAIVLAIFLSGGWGAGAVFILTGLAAGFAATAMPSGSERVYWITALLLTVLILANVFGNGLNRYLFILPIVFALSYFFARLTRKLLSPASQI